MSDTNPAAAPDQPDVEAEFEDLFTTPTTDEDNVTEPVEEPIA